MNCGLSCQPGLEALRPDRACEQMSITTVVYNDYSSLWMYLQCVTAQRETFNHIWAAIPSLDVSRLPS